MQVLTPTGYVNIEDLNVGDEVIAYDINDGHMFTNILEAKDKWTYDMFPPVPPVYETDAEGNIVYDEDGNPIILVPGKTSEEVFQDTYGDWKFYLINNTWTLFWGQSVWANMDVVHANELQVGDIVYDDNDNDVVITDIQEVTAPDWWRLTISGDHSYIADNLTLHNASRYWVGGGSSANWNATGNTNWGSTSGGANNATVPTSVDDAIFDGAGTNGNTSSTISATITILSLNITSAYTATMTFNALLSSVGSVTFGANMTIAGSGGIAFTGTTATLTSNGKTIGGGLYIGNTNSTTLTLVGNCSMTGIVSTGSSVDPTISRTTTETITCFGINLGRSLRGVADIYVKGGTITTAGSNLPCYHSIYIDGNVTVSVVQLGGLSNTFGYVSGVISGASTATLGISLTTYNVPSLTWGSLGIYGNCTLQQSISTTSGLFSTAGGGGNTVNTSNGSTITCVGITNSGNNPLLGNVVTTVTGGTLTCSTFISSSWVGLPIVIAGNVTIGTSFVVGAGGSITYSSGTVITTGSTLYIQGNETLNTNGINWNNVTISATNVTVTLTSNLTINGLYTWDNGSVINRTTAETVTLNGGGTSLGYGNSGTADIYLTGGTLSGGNSNSSIGNNLYINGNCTLGNFAGFGGSTGKTFKYLSGTVTCTGTFTIAGVVGSTIDVAAITFNNIEIKGSGTLVANFTCSGSITTTNASGSTLNKTASEIFTVGGGMTMTQNLTGTAPIYFTGGTWSGAGTLGNPLFIQGNVTISGSVRYTTNTLTYVSGSVTTTGSTLIINGASTTLNTGVMLWNNLSIVSASGMVVTLTSNLNVNGVFTMSGPAFTTTLNRTTAEVVNVAGGLAITGANLTGTAEFYLTGGTWSASGYTIFSPLFINGNVTISGTVYKGGTLTYVSGSVTTTGSTLIINGASIFNTNGITWNNVSTVAVSTVTLTSNFTINGLLNVISGGGLTVNKTASERIIINGGITTTNGIGGTADLYWQGGTWTVGIGGIGNPLYINGNVTMPSSGTVSGTTFTYLSGNVNNINCTLILGGATMTLDVRGVLWNNVTSDGTTKIITLTSDFNINGLFLVSGNTTFNTSNGSIVNLNNGITINLIQTTTLQGTASVYLNGGTWTHAQAGYIILPLFINGNITINGTVNFTSNTITYLRGRINSDNGILALPLGGNVIGFNKAGLRAVQVGQSRTITMDQCISGTPGRICTIVSQGGLVFNISFTNPFEKISENAVFTSARVLTPMQLISASNPRIQTNKATNSGFRYVNGMPNGFPKNAPMAKDTMVYPALGLVSDPNFTKQG